MGDSREASPDWLRSFQAPTQSITTLSSDSEPSSDKSPARDDNDIKHRTSNLLEEDGEEDEKNCKISPKTHTKKSSNKKSPVKKTTKKRLKAGDETTAKRIKTGKRGSEDDENVKREETSDKSAETPATAPIHSVCDLSSDSESNLDATMREKKEIDEDDDDDDDTALISTVIGKSTKKQMKKEDVQPTEKKTHEPVKMEGEVGNMDIAEENKLEKQTEAAASSSTLPLILPDKVHRSKALVECEGESIDLSGDMGAVGRVIISETPSKESEMFLDLKGTIYKTVIVPSRTFCVVSIGQSEAKIEAIMNDFIQLKPQSNVYDAETMVEGTLEGFNFDSDDETDKMTKDSKGDQNEGEEKPNKKAKGKAEKKPAATKKKGKDVGGKQPKKRKPQAPKKGKGC
ncbi:DNA-binding protein BIN4-like isoform X2 [Chenopodium quinoa]|uniref:DNA-binding protein BIN4-like isoform X2 n=1 Tax=Chenopodium quinoa TaxID=63459 RepID=UPI000B791C98|nr:DNA-binding protein BIN4-like isoform X2 [Chenopodium quinoa]